MWSIPLAFPSTMLSTIAALLLRILMPVSPFLTVNPLILAWAFPQLLLITVPLPPASMMVAPGPFRDLRVVSRPCRAKGAQVPSWTQTTSESALPFWGSASIAAWMVVSVQPLAQTVRSQEARDSRTVRGDAAAGRPVATAPSLSSKWNR